jgi:dienelactone hydrolase
LHHTLKLAAILFLAAQSSNASAIDNLKAYAAPVIGEDLVFPTKPEPFGYAKANRMFKPDGKGPFPALVVMPTCGGHLARHAFDVWAKAALQRGYAVLVVDPLTPRGVTAPAENCLPPTRVREARLRKDAFDAAEHLRKQTFVDPERVGLLGLSQGAMAALAAAATGYDTPQDRRAFRAIVSIYPVCFLANLQIPGRSGPANIHYIPDTRVAVPLLVQMGELDTEGPPQDCISRLQVWKERGAPVQLVVHKNATHGWDQGRNFTKTAANGTRVEYRYNPKVTAESVKIALEFLDRNVRESEQKR